MGFELPVDFFTIEMLSTYAGLILAVYVFVAFTKGFIKKWFTDEVVRLFALLVAFIIQVFVLYVQSKIGVETIGLAFLNAVLVALSTTGLHEVIFDPKATKNRKE